MVAERSVSNPGSLRAARSVFANVDSFLSRDGPKLVYEYSGKRAIEETPAVGDTAWAISLKGGMEVRFKTAAGMRIHNNGHLLPRSYSCIKTFHTTNRTLTTGA